MTDQSIITIVTVIVGAIPPTLVALAAFRQSKQNAVENKASAITTAAKIDEVHNAVNGKMEQLLNVSKTAAKAEGKLEQREQTESKL